MTARVLVVHNFYRSATPSGENMVVEDEVSLLQHGGYQVELLAGQSDNIAGWSAEALSAPMGPIYNPVGVAKFKRAIRQFNPQIVHLHNPFPLFSPSVINSAKRRGIIAVQTVHNYRHTCPSGINFRDGHICNDCVGLRLPWPSVKYGCYRDSHLQSIPMAVSSFTHAHTWRKVDHFFVLNPLASQRLRTIGIQERQISMRPTWAPDPGTPSLPGRRVLFLGRLDRYKGIDVLLDGWQTSSLPADGWTLDVVGDGELREMVVDRADSDRSITYWGRLAGEELQLRYRAAGFVAVPSRLYEGYPRVISEAFSHGRPVLVAAEVAATPSLPPAASAIVPDTKSWASILSRVDKFDMAQMSRAARKYWTDHLSPETALQSLTEKYEELLRSPVNPASGSRALPTPS